MPTTVDPEIIAHKGDHYLLRCTCPVCGETWEIDTILDHGSYFACNEDRDECPFAEEHEKEKT